MAPFWVASNAPVLKIVVSDVLSEVAALTPKARALPPASPTALL
jgi:hypothetical protein